MIGDLLLKRRELKILQPAREVSGSQCRGFGDRFAGHPDRERLGFESRATASGARLGELILAEKHPDVLLVALFLEPLEERKHPEVAAFLVMEQKLPVARRNVFPAHIQANAACTGGLAQQTPPAFVPRLGPGIERTGGEGAARIRHDQRFVVLQDGAEPVACGTRATRIVEREERRREHGRGAAAG